MKKVVWILLSCSVLSGMPVLAKCPSMDLTGDCFVDLADLAVMSQWWLAACDASNGWCEGADPLQSGSVGIDDLASMVSLWQTGERLSSGMVWVYIHDSGVSGHEGFNGFMSRYETTNAQYCQFLNAALVSGDITVSGNYVKGASGSNPGDDFVGRNYYNLAGSGLSVDGATHGGATRIHWTGSSLTVDSGFENHPVTYVSGHGAKAFCNFYGWRLPTEWEWQAVADYNGSFDYPYGTTLDSSLVNSSTSTHPDGTTPVGAFGAYGYGMADMAGNAWELTSSIFNVEFGYLVIRGAG